MINSLSGRFLVLTVLVVMLAEVLIFVPSIARFREDYLKAGLERAQIASLAKLSTNVITDELEAELLNNAKVFNVVLSREGSRRLMLQSDLPTPVYDTFDLRDTTSIQLIGDAMMRLFDTQDRVIRVVGVPALEAGQLIEVTMATMPLRMAMIDYGIRILILSAVISVITAFFLFFAVRRFLVKPIKGVVGAMQSYASSPEDARRIISPSAGVTELHEAEEALQSMQTQLTGALKQRERLAQLGEAVSKISHDLRNILTTSQLFTDRIEMSEDPAVRKLAPKLVGSITRAVNLCENTLAFGRAEEPAPTLQRIKLSGIVEDVLDSEKLANESDAIRFEDDIPIGMVVRADPEQLHRVLSNLVRNARHAITSAGIEARISVEAEEDDTAWHIRVKDTGPGLPPKAREHLFQPFQGSASKGGSGLGLAISAELIRGHGGRLDLLRSDSTGTEFAICLPKSDISLNEL